MLPGSNELPIAIIFQQKLVKHMKVRLSLRDVQSSHTHTKLPFRLFVHRRSSNIPNGPTGTKIGAPDQPRNRIHEGEGQWRVALKEVKVRVD